MTNTPDKTVEAVARAIEHAPLRLAGTPNDTDVYLTLFDYIEDGLEEEDFEGFGVSNVYEIYLAIVEATARAAIKAHTECLMERFQKDAEALRSEARSQQWGDGDKQRVIAITDAAVEYAQSTLQAMLSTREKT